MPKTISRNWQTPSHPTPLGGTAAGTEGEGLVSSPPTFSVVAYLGPKTRPYGMRRVMTRLPMGMAKRMVKALKEETDGSWTYMVM
jgi:hypothetical protein